MMSNRPSLRQRQKGFTLIELLVYIILSSIVIVVASKFWFDSTSFSIRSKAKLKSTSDASMTMMYFEEEIRRIGANIDLSGTEMALDSFIYRDVSGGDFSSFDIADNGAKDSLYYLTSVYDENGEHIHNEAVSLKVSSDGELTREVQKYDLLTNSPDGSPVVTTYATGVDTLKFKMGTATQVDSIDLATKPLMVASDLKAGGETSISPVETSDGVLLSGFLEGSTSTWTLATAETEIDISIERSKSYELRFNTTVNEDFEYTFNPITDTLKLELIDGSTNEAIEGIPAFTFYPGEINEEVIRTFEFNAGDDLTGANFVFTTHFNKVIGTPTLSIKDVYFNEVGQGAYVWATSSDSDYEDLKQVSKVLEVYLVINNKTNLGRENASRIRKIISMPNNGI